MKDHNGLILLLAACFLATHACPAAGTDTEPKKKSDPPFKNAQFFHRNNPGDNLTLMLFQREDGRWMLNVEPGCIIAEVKHDKIREDTYRFTFLGWGMVGFAKTAMKIKADSFDVLYEERKPPTMNKLVKISEVNGRNKAEQ